MSDHLPGNPYGDATVENIANFGEQVIAVEGQTDATIIWQGICHLAGATMALAYEQRTANLIAFSDVLMKSGVGPETIGEAAQRMGVTDD